MSQEAGETKGGAFAYLGQGMSAIIAPVKMLSETPFGVTFMVFVTAQIVFVFGTKMAWSAKLEAQNGETIVGLMGLLLKNGFENSQGAFLMASVYILVLVNTLIFIRGATKPHGSLSSLNEQSGKVANDRYNDFITLLIVSVFLAGAMALWIGGYWWRAVGQEYWTELMQFNEGVAVAIYGMFLLADWRCLKMCDAALKTESGLDDQGRAVVQPFRDEVKKFIMTCDAPGLLGLVVIVTISHFLHPILAGLYWQGLVTGAIALHIAFSQSVLAFVNSR